MKQRMYCVLFSVLTLAFVATGCDTAEAYLSCFNFRVRVEQPIRGLDPANDYYASITEDLKTHLATVRIAAPVNAVNNCAFSLPEPRVTEPNLPITMFTFDLGRSNIDFFAPKVSFEGVPEVTDPNISLSADMTGADGQILMRYHQFSGEIRLNQGGQVAVKLRLTGVYN